MIPVIYIAGIVAAAVIIAVLTVMSPTNGFGPDGPRTGPCPTCGRGQERGWGGPL